MIYFRTSDFKIPAKVYVRLNEDTLAKRYEGAGERTLLQTIFFAKRRDIDFYKFSPTSFESEDKTLIAKRSALWFRGIFAELEFDFAGGPGSEEIKGTFKIDSASALENTGDNYFEITFKES